MNDWKRIKGVVSKPKTPSRSAKARTCSDLPKRFNKPLLTKITRNVNKRFRTKSGWIKVENLDQLYEPTECSQKKANT